MKTRNWEDYFGDEVSQPTVIARQNILDADLTIYDGPPDSITPGYLDGTFEGAQAFSFHLTAGVTYSFAQRPTDTGGIEDAFLYLFDSDGAFITYDDDGGAGRSSLLSFTPTTTGNYTLLASSWVNEFDGGGDIGNYNLFQWNSTQPDAGDTLATAMSITTGTTFGSRPDFSDVDIYQIELTAGQVYTFGYSGGYDGAGETGTVGRIQLLDSAGNIIVNPAVAAESGMSYFAQTSGTYYVKVTPFGAPGAAVGGYTLDVASIDPSTRNPLEAFNWDSAGNVPTVDVDGVPTVYVYFAPAGENLTPGEVNLGWQPHQIDAVMHALQNQYTPITGINYEITTDQSLAEFRMITVQNQTYGARFYPQDPAYGALQGIGSFNLLSGGFGSDPASLLPGGFSYGVILHEFGHAHGVAHPHDTGGGSEIMLGVTGATGSLGVYDLNQGVYTVMSYNDGWNTHPDGDRNYSIANRASGWSETLGAFDIAVLQARYGEHAANVGDTVYTIADTQAQASYQTIWDTGGTDTIDYVGIRDVQIDLLDASLDYTPTGGGVVSFAHNVWGGFTIANGVVVENATGGSGNDVLLGNEANNVLTGNIGNDTLMGREGNDRLVGGDGNDFLYGGAGRDILLGGAGTDRVISGDGIDVATLGAGNDTFVAEVGATKVALKTGTMSVDIITDFDALGDDLIDVSGLGVAFNFRGTAANKNAGDLTYKTYGNVNAAENALGFDIDGNPGASEVSGPVTVVYGNTNGGAADFAIVLLNTRGVDASDFLTTAAASAASAASYGMDPSQANYMNAYQYNDTYLY